MALTTCMKCGGHTYEVRQFEPSGGNYKQIMVQCTSCGVPVGALDYYNVGAQTEDIKKTLKTLGNSLDEIKTRLSRIEQKIR